MPQYISIKGPDGRIVKFPSTMKNDEIMKAMERIYSKAMQPSHMPTTAPPMAPAHTHPTLSDMAEAIKTHEGWYPESRSFRNNNPGNLRFAGQEGAVGKDKKRFAVFKDYESGWKALVNQLDAAATGRSASFSPDHTLYEFFNRYAPSSDTNRPKQYAEEVAKRLGVAPTIRLRELVPTAPAMPSAPIGPQQPAPGIGNTIGNMISQGPIQGPMGGLTSMMGGLTTPQNVARTAEQVGGFMAPAGITGPFERGLQAAAEIPAVVGGVRQLGKFFSGPGDEELTKLAKIREGRMIALKRAVDQAPKEFQEEIRWKLEVDDLGPDEIPPDLFDAFDDVWNIAEENRDNKLARIAKDIAIKIGYLRPRTGEVVTMGGDRPYTKNGVKYDPVTSWEHWSRRPEPEKK